MVFHVLEIISFVAVWDRDWWGVKTGFELYGNGPENRSPIFLKMLVWGSFHPNLGRACIGNIVKNCLDRCDVWNCALNPQLRRTAVMSPTPKQPVNESWELIQSARITCGNLLFFLLMDKRNYYGYQIWSEPKVFISLQSLNLSHSF